MGLPEILINFKTSGTTAVKRSERGIVALILKDDTNSEDTKVYRSFTDVEEGQWTADNHNYIKMAFTEAPAKVIVERLATTATDYSEALTRLKNKYFNYLAVPAIATGDVEAIGLWIKDMRDNYQKTFKAVLPAYVGDHEGIINFVANNIVVGNDTYTGSQYTARIAGLLAALPLSMSATYAPLNEVDKIDEPVDPDADIDAGQLILLHDGEKVKLGRAVNSLTSTAKGKEFKKIKIIEAVDLMRDDISRTFEEGYIGQISNSYDNKALFIAAVNAYFKELARTEVLDSSYENIAEVDLEATRLYLEASGVDTTIMNDQAIMKYNTGSQVFVKANVKFVDAMEDIKFEINM